MKRFILWDFPRAGWQYDVMVGVILAFVFVTPREWFRDQPRTTNVVQLPAGHGASVYWMEPGPLVAVPGAQRSARAVELIRQRTGKTRNLVRLEPIFNEEQEIRGFMAYTNP